jgi:SAM-dependent methyltransferase
LTIEWIYENKPAGAGRLGPLLDRCFLNEPAGRAVRNRRGLLAEEIGKSLESGDDVTRVTSLACGPAAEIFDVLADLESPERFKATLIDIDLQALAFVTDRAKKLKYSRYIKAVNANLVYLATSRHELDLPPQDLVYSIGLIDYFSDAFVVRLIDYVHGLLKPGGRLILGNFHPSNGTRALMDHILQWKLIHRTEDDMNRLCNKSKFGRPCTNMRFEEEGINLFAECVKES